MPVRVRGRCIRPGRCLGPCRCIAAESRCCFRTKVHAAAAVAAFRVPRPARRRNRICDSSALSTAFRPAPKTMPDALAQRPSAHARVGARPVAWHAARVGRAVRPAPGRHPLQGARHGWTGGVGGSERISWCTQSVHQWRRAASRVFVREGCPRRCRGGATFGNGGGASGHAGNRGVLRSAGDGWGRCGAVDGDGQGGWRIRDPSRWPCRSDANPRVPAPNDAGGFSAWPDRRHRCMSPDGSISVTGRRSP